MNGLYLLSYSTLDYLIIITSERVIFIIHKDHLAEVSNRAGLDKDWGPSLCRISRRYDTNYLRAMWLARDL